ncbi:hypothetical protein BASA81_001719 [Batrachochytrium salamandrivorans]|nr:hypothetical protein BASA81_001719 [Batrachochytrium salamandrivorans]
MEDHRNEGSLWDLPTHLTVRYVYPYLTLSECLCAMTTCKQLCRDVQTSMENWFETVQVTGLSFPNNLHNMQRVAKLKLSQTCSAVLGNCIQDVGARLRVVECDNVEMLQLSPTLTDSILFEIARSCPMLQVIKLEGGDLAITDWGVRCLAHSACSRFLVEVSIAGASSVTDVGILLERCPNLQRVAFPRCLAIKRLAVGAAEGGRSDRPNRLSVLDLSSNTELQILTPLLGFQNLHSVNLSGCGLIDDSALVLLVQASPLLADVSVSYCAKLTDFGLKRFFALLRGRTLRKFVCARCVRVGDVGLMALCNSAQDALLELDCQHCHLVTDALLGHLGSKCPNLQTLHMRGMDLIEDAGVVLLCQGCVGLQRLSLAACTKLSNAALFAVARHLHALRHLDLFCVSEVTDDGLIELAGRCLALGQINVSWCFQLSSDLVLELKQSRRFPLGISHEGLEMITSKQVRQQQPLSKPMSPHQTHRRRHHAARERVPTNQLGFVHQDLMLPFCCVLPQTQNVRRQ